MNPTSYVERRGKIEDYFDRTAVQAWARLTSDAPVGRIRATVRAGRDRMRLVDDHPRHRQVQAQVEDVRVVGAVVAHRVPGALVRVDVADPFAGVVEVAGAPLTASGMAAALDGSRRLKEASESGSSFCWATDIQ